MLKICNAKGTFKVEAGNKADTLVRGDLVTDNSTLKYYIGNDALQHWGTMLLVLSFNPDM